MTKLKDPLTFEEQADRMNSFHKIKIDDKEKAVLILSSINYYKLLGYGIGLTDSLNKDVYVDCSLDKLYNLYTFDSKLRNDIQLCLEYIEIEFKTKFANYLSLKYGALGYMDQSFFEVVAKADGTIVHDDIIDDFKKEIERHKNLPFVKHHIENYDGCFPFWVAVELITFGNIVSFYKILKCEDKDAIASMYNTDSKYLCGWLLSFVEIRNICAHNNRLYNIKLKQKPYMYKSKMYDKKQINSEKMFPFLLTIRRFFNSDKRWIAFRDKLIDLITEYQGIINFNYLGFPNKWKEILMLDN